MPSPRLVTTDEKGNWRVASKLLPHLWEYKNRIAVALVFLVLARAANVTVPLALKKIVDHFEGIDGALLVVPLALLIAYGVLRFSTILFNELRNMVFTRAAIEIIHHISMQVFAHLHHLSLAFHLDRKTGGLSRDLERGNMAVTRPY